MGVGGAALRQIETVYRERGADFRRVAAAILGDSDHALDAVQDAFAAAVRRREAYRGDAPLEAWLWRIVVNHARSELRSARRMAHVDLASNGHAPEEDGGGRVAVALAALTERQRLVVFLRHYADLDYRTIAETLDVSPGTIAATLNQAHSTLRRALEEVPR